MLFPEPMSDPHLWVPVGTRGDAQGRRVRKAQQLRKQVLNPDLRGARVGGWKANDHQLSFHVTIANVSASGPVLASWLCNFAE